MLLKYMGNDGKVCFNCHRRIRLFRKIGIFAVTAISVI